MLTADQSKVLNDAIDALDDRQDLPTVVGLAGTGKAVPYIGWYWRDVDFTQPVSFGRCRTEASVGAQLAGRAHLHKPEPSWCGFMENNKWDYPEWTTTAEQTDEVIARLQAAVAEPTQARLQAVYDYIQSVMPDHIRNWDGKTGYDDWLAEQAAR